MEHSSGVTNSAILLLGMGTTMEVRMLSETIHYRTASRAPLQDTHNRADVTETERKMCSPEAGENMEEKGWSSASYS